ncbi:probable choline kinase 1 isoform X2 [Oryza sativa Japonica Group]|jgi:choline/ethanolamine kinase|uniref:Os01g0183000 protein n=5 Tax=Oryza sativa subsp. japonica TaxID=39947 RepID=Q0JQ41_ORYSJ|nr:Os01g0183000 [Oryza sativa Japonica Group]BAS70748.1 Os01g0183000 [Oryza sativa Japonica Group]|eukprot:NP_001042223.2 Os01g0183000 [Oryza sativa Japonica Group]
MVAVDPPPREAAAAPPAMKRSASFDRVPEEARRILHRLAGELWGGDVDPAALAVSQLKGAMTNEVFRITWPGGGGGEGEGEGDHRKVLVRIYGQGVEVFFDRADEVRTFECMSRHGQGPRLLGRFPNGRIEEFINARTLSAADLRDAEISSLIAKKLREFHDLDMPGPKNVSLWQRLRRWLEEARGRCSPEEARQFSLEKLGDEIAMLDIALSGVDQRVGFCHNDLQYGNIMIYEETRQVTLIDYEYASFNPVAFDIANHFCEMSADYHSATPHVLDFTKYPGIDEQRRFVQTYLSSSGENPSDAEVEHLLGLIAKYSLASHIFWGLWGIISGHVNKNIDFEYQEYARQRFDQYWKTKDQTLGSKSN